MATVHTPFEVLEIDDSDPRIRAHDALQKAAERMQRSMHGKKSATCTPEHREVVATMSLVLSGKVTPEQAMSLLWQYDVLQQRLANL